MVKTRSMAKKMNRPQKLGLTQEVKLVQEQEQEQKQELKQEQEFVTTLSVPLRRSVRIAAKQSLSYKTMVKNHLNEMALNRITEIDTFYKTNKREPSLESQDYREKILAMCIKHVRSLSNTTIVKRLVNKYLPWLEMTEPVEKPADTYKYTNMCMGLMGLTSLFLVLAYSVGQTFMITSIRNSVPLFYKSVPGISYLAL